MSMVKNKRRQIKTDYSDLFKQIDDSCQDKIGDRKLHVLVFGPDLNGDELGTQLRKYIINRCKDDAYTVVLAEHEEIQKRYEKIYKSANDFCKMEYSLALDKVRGQDIIDGIIIIPDSAGSLIELGMFVIADSIHSKILVLFNKEYESKIPDNFIGKGAKPALDNGNAITIILDYNNIESAWVQVSKFLKHRRGLRNWHTWRRQIESST